SIDLAHSPISSGGIDAAYTFAAQRKYPAEATIVVANRLATRDSLLALFTYTLRIHLHSSANNPPHPFPRNAYHLSDCLQRRARFSGPNNCFIAGDARSRRAPSSFSPH